MRQPKARVQVCFHLELSHCNWICHLFMTYCTCNKAFEIGEMPNESNAQHQRKVLQNLKKNNSRQTFQDNCHILQICPRQRCQNMAIYMQAACTVSTGKGRPFSAYCARQKMAKPNSPFRSNVCTTWSQPGVNVGQLAANLGPAWLEFGSNFAQVGPKLLGGSLAQVVLNPRPK